MESLGLRTEDEEKVREVLKDVKECMNCEIGIAGSLAQRALSPIVAAALAGKPLNDIDLLLIGATEVSPETPELRLRFNVTEVVHASSWYYGLTHISTGIWVDLLSPSYNQRLVPVTLDGVEYRATSIESQILFLAHDILRRIKTGSPVRRKWLEKLSFLNSLEGLNREQLQDEYATHTPHFNSVLPQKETLPMLAADYIALASRQKQTPCIKEHLFLIYWKLFLRKRQ
jgi:hypothetical protein